MPTEFEELKLQVTLVDEASSKLEDIKKDFDSIQSGKHVEQIQGLQRAFRELRPIVGSFGTEFSKVNQVLGILTSRGSLATTAIVGLGGGMAAGAIGLEKLSTNLNELKQLSTITGIGMQQIRNIEEVLRQTGRIPHEKFGQIIHALADAEDQIMRHGSALRERLIQLSGEHADAMIKYLDTIEAKLRAGEKGAAETMILRIPTVIRGATGEGKTDSAAAAEMRESLSILGLPAEVVGQINEIVTATKEQEAAMGRLTGQTEKFADAMGRIKNAAVLIDEEFGKILANTFLPTMIRGLELLGDALDTIAGVMKRIRDEGLLNVMGAGKPVPTGPMPPGLDPEQQDALRRQRQGVGPSPRPGGAVMPQQLMSGGVAGFTGPYEPMRDWGPAAKWAEETFHGEPSTNLERRDLMEKENDTTRELIDQMKRTNRLLGGEEQPLGLLSTQFGGLRTGLGGGIGAGYGGYGAGPAGGGDGRGGRGGTPGGATSSGTSGTPGVGPVAYPALGTPELPRVSYGGVQGLPGTPSGPAPGQPAQAPEALPRQGLPGTPSGPAATRTATEAGGNQWIAQQRAALMDEVNRDPALRDRISAVLAHETHGDQIGAQGVMETMINRAMRLGHKSLWTTISKETGFYGPVNRNEVGPPTAQDKKIGYEAIRRVAGGSNITDFRDDQGTNKYGQPEVPKEGSGVTRIGDAGPGRGEHFYYSGPAARAFAERMRRGAATTPTTPTTAGSVGTQAGAAGARLGGEIRLGEAGAHGYRRGGVQTQEWLVDTVRQASRVLPPGYRAEVISSVDPRSTGTPWHPSGRAIDIQIYDEKGNKVPYTGDRSVAGYSLYARMAAFAKAYQQKNYPNEQFIWGGHFHSGTPYDRMHFQSGGISAETFTKEEAEQGRTDLAALEAQRTQVAGQLPTREAPITTPRVTTSRAGTLTETGAGTTWTAAESRAEVDSGTIAALAARRRARRALGTANINVDVKDHTSGHKNVAQIGPFRKVRSQRMSQMVNADSGPETHVTEAGTAESHDPSLDS